MGDTGKSYLALELGLRVAAGRLDFGLPPIFGGRIVSFGPVVIICAEDGKADIHRRLH
jgi:RecA-family ATPase